MRAKDLSSYNLDESIPYLMNRVVGRQNRGLEEDLLEMGISFQHWRVLAVLAMGDGLSIADLSAYAVVPHSTLSRLLTRLEEEGLIERSAQTPDGRTAHILLTPGGRALYRKIVPLAIEHRESALVDFTAAEKNQLCGLLKRMLANLEIQPR